MATATKTRSADRWLVISTDWAGYRAMLKIRGERGSSRIIYLDGRLTLTSAGFSNEVIKKRLGTFIQEVATGLRIRAVFAGSTTLWWRRRRSGIEGDETYYFANYGKIAGKKEIDLRVDPPPDLAVEAVVSHPFKEALEVYRRLGVPEVWVCDGRTLRIMVLQADRSYGSATTSVSMTMLAAELILKWVQHDPDADDITWALAVRRWVADELAPQYRAGDVPP